MDNLDKNEIIWRYIGLDKFIDLLLNKRLIFTPIEAMADRNEVRWILDTIDESTENHRPSVEKFIELHLKNNFISCWTINPNEKISLWRHYLGKDGIGVAIQSKVENFYKYVKWGEKLFSIQKVAYEKKLRFEDIEKGKLNFTKSLAYKDEEELRVFTHFNFTEFDDESKKPIFFNPPKIISIGIELENFIEGIMTSPFCADWQIDLIKQITSELAPTLSDKFHKSIIREKN